MLSSPASVSWALASGPASFFDCFPEADAIFLAHKAHHVAAGVAAEAVVKVGLGVHGKGRDFLLMEGTEADVVTALLLERDAVGLDDQLGGHGLAPTLRSPPLKPSFRPPLKKLVKRILNGIMRCQEYTVFVYPCQGVFKCMILYCHEKDNCHCEGFRRSGGPRLIPSAAPWVKGHLSRLRSWWTV